MTSKNQRNKLLSMRIYVKTDPDNQTLRRPVYGGDAGYDITASENPTIVGAKTQNGLYTSIDYIEYETNVALAPENENQFYSLICPRSSISKYNLVLANSVGIVDSGYRNSIKLRFKYISQPEDLELIVSKAQDDEDSIFSLAGIKINQEKIYKKGDQIGQVVFMGHNQPFIDFTHDLPPSDRALDGFGSTDR